MSQQELLKKIIQALDQAEIPPGDGNDVDMGQHAQRSTSYRQHASVIKAIYSW
jgi:hypothetical protein